MSAIGRLAAAATLIGALASASAEAHPHVWVTARSEIVFDRLGAITAIRQSWTFDEMFASYALQGLDSDGDGRFLRAELQPLAETNMAAMAESEFFTFASTEAGAVAFGPPADDWLDWDGKALTLHFTLPLVRPVARGETLTVKIGDPTFFVDFALAERQPATLAGAPEGCSTFVQRPGVLAPQPGAASAIPEAFFTALTRPNYGEQFASRIVVRCLA